MVWPTPIYFTLEEVAEETPLPAESFVSAAERGEFEAEFMDDFWLVNRAEALAWASRVISGRVDPDAGP